MAHDPNNFLVGRAARLRRFCFHQNSFCRRCTESNGGMSLNVDLDRLSRRVALAHRDRSAGNEAIAVEEVKKVSVLVGAHDSNDMHRPVQWTVGQGGGRRFGQRAARRRDRITVRVYLRPAEKHVYLFNNFLGHGVLQYLGFRMHL